MRIVHCAKRRVLALIASTSSDIENDDPSGTDELEPWLDGRVGGQGTRERKFAPVGSTMAKKKVEMGR